MACRQCQGIERQFNVREVARDLKTYRRNGPSKTTRMLIEALEAAGVEGQSLLDIGGGVGAIQHALLRAGASGATHVDASSAYLDAAKEEAERQGHAELISHQHGDFVELAPEVSAADIVTLDKVICCYHDVVTLVGLSAERARKLYGLVYPRDNWWLRPVFPFFNLLLRLMRRDFRVFLHPTKEVDALVGRHGLRRRFYGTTLIWQVVVYGR
ncbi:MAG: methyltransferase domain-containing protein [Trueperaceae bacterium]|nr:MAG: methyltransferase domain-containing protein [Trueperaceae bacterium]